MKGTVERIYISAQSRKPVTQVKEVELVMGKGIAGDRYYTKAQQLLDEGKLVPENHFTLISKQVLDDFLQQQGVYIDYGDFRRNMLTSGIELNDLVGEEFFVGEARCFGAELCEPCAFLAASVHKAVLPELVHKGGLRAIVLEGGSVAIGDDISS